MIDGQNFFDQPIRNNLITYDNIRKISTGQGDNYTTGFKKYYNMITIDLTKQQALNADPKAIQQTNFTGNLEQKQQYFSLLKKLIRSSSANIKLSKTQLRKLGQSGRFLGRRLGPLLKTGLPLIRKVFKPLAKSVLIPLGLIAAASATDAAIHEKMFGSGTTTLIISNEEMNDIMKVIKSLEESGLLMKGVRETSKMK